MDAYELTPGEVQAVPGTVSACALVGYDVFGSHGHVEELDAEPAVSEGAELSQDII